MKILNNEKNLATFLESVREQKIVIASAFASGTEKVIDTILDNGNSLELVIGTINAFSSPDLFEYCKNIKNDKLSMFVDFGYQNSIHWKLYLITPATVIIGSANFTNAGLSLTRDTCVMIEDKTLLKEYMKAIATIKSSCNMVGCNEKRFQNELKKYREIHRRMQAGRIRSVQAGDGDRWLAQEENQLIPVFIWDSRHTKATIEEAHKLLKEDSEDQPDSVLRDFFTYPYDEENFPYDQGDLVLCVNSNGSYADFYSFDRILHKDGISYIYSYRKNITRAHLN